ncbi:MAG: NAD(P)H-quinone oxidoreductase [Alphaproteobacteria bacterium]|nr:NAD(P)H-quinone oxidoreductase [Alphaproteobacteria bacterium]
MKAVSVKNPGADYSLALEEIATPIAAKGEVLIKVASAGINRADLLQAAGGYPPPPGAPATLGLEVSGKIEAVGPEVSRFRAGDEVCALLAGGGYAEYCVVAQESVLPVPQGIDLAEAAALPEAHFTVWTNLMDAARLKPKESVLIHGGSSGIGTAAIQLCAARGHDVFTTAASEAKCTACRELGARIAINYREQDFVEVIKRETGGRGIDVILDMVGGDYIQRNFSAAALWGRIVNIAFQSGMSANVNFAGMLMKRLSLMATTLRARSNSEKGEIAAAVEREVWPLIASGKIRPVIDRSFPLAEAQQAHEHMRAGNHIGKILLRT